jgi:hypothetical protein
VQDDLRAFHAKHFSHASAPEHFLHGVEQEPTGEYFEEEYDVLGYYPDGTKRTITDEQIAMFRHSEIQTILRKRLHRLEAGELSEEGEAKEEVASEPASPKSTKNSPILIGGESHTPDGNTLLQRAMIANGVQSGRIEKTKTQQWTTSSARTKAKNKRNRNKYRAKKKGEKLLREPEETNGSLEDNGDEESDEWDPWHQANGPDAQKADTVDLDY